MTLKPFLSLCIALTLAAAGVSCSDFVRDQGRSPSQVVIQLLEGARGNAPTELGSPLVSDVETAVTTPDPCTTSSPCLAVFNDIGQVTMSIVLKDPGQTGLTSTPSQLNTVTFSRYRVEYRRADGRNTPGVDVPFPIDSAVTFTVPADGAVTASFELVRNTAKREAPLRELRNSNVVMSTIADVTFYGRDQAGNAVTAAGSIGVNFGDFLP